MGKGVLPRCINSSARNMPVLTHIESHDLLGRKGPTRTMEPKSRPCTDTPTTAPRARERRAKLLSSGQFPEEPPGQRSLPETQRAPPRPRPPPALPIGTRHANDPAEAAIGRLAQRRPPRAGASRSSGPRRDPRPAPAPPRRAPCRAPAPLGTAHRGLSPTEPRGLPGELKEGPKMNSL